MLKVKTTVIFFSAEHKSVSVWKQICSFIPPKGCYGDSFCGNFSPRHKTGLEQNAVSCLESQTLSVLCPITLSCATHSKEEYSLATPRPKENGSHVRSVKTPDVKIGVTRPNKLFFSLARDCKNIRGFSLFAASLMAINLKHFLGKFIFCETQKLNATFFYVECCSLNAAMAQLKDCQFWVKTTQNYKNYKQQQQTNKIQLSQYSRSNSKIL